MRSEGVKQIRLQFARYLQLLKEEFSQGLILPTGKESSTSTANQNSNKPGTISTTNLPSGQTPPANTQSKALNTTSPDTAKIDNESGKLETKRLTMTEEFKCRANGNI